MRNPFSKLISWSGKLCRHPKVQEQLTGLFQFAASGSYGRRLMGRHLTKHGWYHLMLAQIQRKEGDDHGAFVTLMLGQRNNFNDPRMHIKLSEILRDNGDLYGAHIHVKAAEAQRPGYSSIRRLTFETDHGLLEDGSATMGRVLEIPGPLVKKHMVMLNRVSIFYPEHREALNKQREELKTTLRTQNYPGPRVLSEAVKTALTNRWLRLAIELAQGNEKRLLPEIQKLLDRLTNDLGDHLVLLDAAWDNETGDDLIAIKEGRAFPLSEVQDDRHQVVELFLPTPFFASPELEKPTYHTIRAAFVNVIRTLTEMQNVTIVPRLQLFWRQCIPKTHGARVISYHTSSPADPLRLHIQEAPLAGRCSFDHSGFAGFASIATDHSTIKDFVAKVSEADLIQNQKDMHERYVMANLSKYIQPTDSRPISGDYVFVALQIPTDVVSRLAWISGIDLLKQVVDHFSGTSTRVVVKRHPFCGSKAVQECLDQLEKAGKIIRTTDSIHSIVSGAKLVLTVNSGVGLEALMHGKPVVVSGACDYSYAATAVTGPAELREVLSRNPQPDVTKIRELLYYYFHRFTLAAADGAVVRSRLEEWLNTAEDR